MFANLDYPERRRGLPGDGRARGARSCSAELGGRPSLAVLCGNSEVEQQVAMLGLDPALAARRAVRRAAAAARRARPASTRSTCPSAPCGGELPVPPRPRRRQLLRRRRLPAPARGRPPRRRALRRRVPRVRERARRGRRSRSCCRGAGATRRAPPALEGRRAARRGHRLGLRRRPRPLPARRSSASTRRAAPHRPRALPGALARASPAR